MSPKRLSPKRLYMYTPLTIINNLHIGSTFWRGA